MTTAVTRELIVAAYQLLLGRPPESEGMIDYWMTFPNVDKFRQTLMCSPEFTMRFFNGDDILHVPLVNFIHIHTQRITARRQEHLAMLGLPITGKSVLEVGGGIGLHSTFFLDRGCTVLCTDGREANVLTMRALYDNYGWYEKRKNIDFAVLDIEAPKIDRSRRRDIVYCYGLLYHVGNPALSIANMAGLCDDMLLLETGVSRENNSTSLGKGPEGAAIVSQSIHGEGSHSSRQYIFAELKKHFPFVYNATIQPSHEVFPEDWSQLPATQQTIRTVFVASRTPLSSPYLVERIVDRQPHR